jgi:DNA-directed RNA polymerase specialized sigma24 family protein
MFPGTQWTELAHATLHGDTQGRDALAQLCRLYWEPVKRCIMQRGWQAADTDDMTQNFFLYVMEKGVLHRADRERGKFRHFLQGVLTNFLHNERNRQLAAKRGGGVEHAELDETEFSSSDQLETGMVFDREWAQALMTTAMRLVEGECRAKRGEEAFDTLGVFLGAEGPTFTYDEGATRLGLGLSAFKSEIMMWRGKLRDYLRSEVRKTVSAPHEVDEELGYIRQLLVS